MRNGKEVTKPMEFWQMLTFCKPNLTYVECMSLTAKRIPDKPEGEIYSYIWVYPGPIPFCKGSDWYHVPGATQYLINRKTTELKSLRSNSLVLRKTANIGIRNHLSYSLTHDGGVEKQIGVHRLMCGTFKGYPLNVGDLHCNHKDSDPTNNHPDNLEFVTVGENNLHGRLCGNAKNVNNLVTIRYKGKTYQTLRLDDPKLPFSKEALWDAYTGSKKIPGLDIIVTFKGFRKRIEGGDIIAVTGMTESATVNIKSISKLGKEFTSVRRVISPLAPTAVDVLDLTNGAVKTYHSVTSAARELKCSESLVTFALYRTKHKVLLNRYCVKKGLDDEFVTTDPVFMKGNNQAKNKTVLIKDVKTKEIIKIKGGAASQRWLEEKLGGGVSKKAFRTDLKNEKQRLWDNRYLFKYEEVTKPWIE